MSGLRYPVGALVVALLMTSALGAMIYNRAQHIKTGREVVIESGFVDPRDLFRGHYVTLNPVVGDLSAGSIEADGKFSRDDPVFVELRKAKDGPYWTATKLWKAIPEESQSPFLAGRISFVPATTQGSYRIRFPIDRFFAEKSRARDLEKLRRKRKLGIVLALAPDGTGYIKGLMIDGEIIYDEPLW